MNSFIFIIGDLEIFYLSGESSSSSYKFCEMMKKKENYCQNCHELEIALEIANNNIKILKKQLEELQNDMKKQEYEHLKQENLLVQENSRLKLINKSNSHLKISNSASSSASLHKEINSEISQYLQRSKETIARIIQIAKK